MPKVGNMTVSWRLNLRERAAGWRCCWGMPQVKEPEGGGGVARGAKGTKEDCKVVGSTLGSPAEPLPAAPATPAPAPAPAPAPDGAGQLTPALRGSSDSGSTSASSSRRSSISCNGSSTSSYSSTSSTSTTSTTSSTPGPLAALRFGEHLEQNRRDHMEDRTISVDLSDHPVFVAAGVRRAAFIGVFDGHAGAEASTHLQEHLLGHVLAEEQLLVEAPGQALAAAVDKVEAEMVAQFAGAGCNAGSTLLAALLLDEQLHVAHAGDCRAVLASGRRATQLTADHKPQSPAERARIAAADPAAWVTGDGYLYGEVAVSRALGSQHLKLDPSKCALTHVPEVLSRVLEKEDDFLVLATDGLWDKVDNAEAVSTARRVLAGERGGPEASAKALVERALNYKSGDNISVVVVCLHDRAISMPKTNSMLFRKVNAEGRCGTPNSSIGLDTPASCNTPGFSKPVGSTTLRERSSSSMPGEPVAAAAQASGNGGADGVPAGPAPV